MFVPLLLILVSLRTLYCSPINSHQALAQDVQSSLTQMHTRDTSTEVCDHVRTTYAIVWSCAFTLFACVWSAVHPNLSDPRDGGWRVLKRHITTALYALIAPELMTLWALRQRIAAQNIAEKYNRTFVQGYSEVPRKSWYGSARQWFGKLPEPTQWNDALVWTEGQNVQPWTETHGHFVQMGGFMLYRNGYPSQVLTFDIMCEKISGGEIYLPTVTDAEIMDRSKGNALSKCFVVLQTSWFMVQCIGRVASKLPLTKLEVTTLGFAVLNGIIYALWWNKPQEVGVAFKVQDRRIELSQVQESGQSGPHRTQAEIQHGENLVQRQSNDNWFKRLGRSISRFITDPWRSLWKMYHKDIDVLLPTTTRVPMYHADKSKLGNSKPELVACVIGTIFGAVHFFGWESSVFPSRAERLIWHISVLIITVVPLLILLVHALELNTGPNEHWLKIFLGFILFISVISGMMFYVLARIALLTVALLSLRALPPQVFIQIRWTSFLPHY